MTLNELLVHGVENITPDHVASLDDDALSYLLSLKYTGQIHHYDRPMTGAELRHIWENTLCVFMTAVAEKLRRDTAQETLAPPSSTSST